MTTNKAMTGRSFKVGRTRGTLVLVSSKMEKESRRHCRTRHDVGGAEGDFFFIGKIKGGHRLIKVETEGNGNWLGPYRRFAAQF